MLVIGQVPQIQDELWKHIQEAIKSWENPQYDLHEKMEALHAFIDLGRTEKFLLVRIQEAGRNIDCPANED
jgi:hypothetical protein